MTRIPLRIQLEGYAIYEEERSFKFYPFWDREITGFKATIIVTNRKIWVYQTESHLQGTRC